MRRDQDGVIFYDLNWPLTKSAAYLRAIESAGHIVGLFFTDFSNAVPVSVEVRLAVKKDLINIETSVKVISNDASVAQREAIVSQSAALFEQVELQLSRRPPVISNSPVPQLPNLLDVVSDTKLWKLFDTTLVPEYLEFVRVNRAPVWSSVTASSDDVATRPKNLFERMEALTQLIDQSKPLEKSSDIAAIETAIRDLNKGIENCNDHQSKPNKGDLKELTGLVGAATALISSLVIRQDYLISNAEKVTATNGKGAAKKAIAEKMAAEKAIADKAAAEKAVVREQSAAGAAQARGNVEQPDGETADRTNARKEKIAKPAPKVARAAEAESAEVMALRNAREEITKLNAALRRSQRTSEEAAGKQKAAIAAAEQVRKTVDVKDKEINDLRAQFQIMAEASRRTQIGFDKATVENGKLQTEVRDVKSKAERDAAEHLRRASLKTEESLNAQAEIKRLETALNRADKGAKAKEAVAEMARREAEIGAAERERQKDGEIKNLREQLSQIKSELDTANAARDTARAALGQSTDGIQRIQTYHLAIVTGLQRDYQAAAAENARRSAELNEREQTLHDGEANFALREAELQRSIRANTQRNLAPSGREQELIQREEALARAEGANAHGLQRLRLEEANLALERTRLTVANTRRSVELDVRTREMAQRETLFIRQSGMSRLAFSFLPPLPPATDAASQTTDTFSPSGRGR